MRTRVYSTRRSLLPLLVGLVTLAACDAASGPEAPTRRLAARGTMPVTDNASQTIERPYGAKLVWQTDSIVTAVQSGDPLFGGRCSVPSRFVEFAHLNGEIMHAGLSRGTGNQCVQGTPKTGLTTTDGIATFTTANGDVLILNWAHATISLVDGLFIVDGQFTFNGGTGRFEGASGAGTQHGEASGTPQDVLAGAPLEVRQTGVITYAPGRGGQ